MLGWVTHQMLSHLPGILHLHVTRPLAREKPLTNCLTRAKQTFRRSGCITVFHQNYENSSVHIASNCFIWHVFILVKIIKQNKTVKLSDLEIYLLIFFYENLYSIPKYLCSNKNYITSEDTLKRVMSPLAHAMQWKQTWKSQPVLTC